MKRSLMDSIAGVDGGVNLSCKEKKNFTRSPKKKKNDIYSFYFFRFFFTQNFS